MNFTVAFVLGIIDGLVGWGLPEIGLGVLGVLYYLAVIPPALGVSVRRLHDIGRSGWSLLLVLIPLVGAIIILVWYCREGEHSSNAWSPDPKNQQS